MGKFLKSFGLGLLYMILSPILLVVLLGYALFGIYNFFVEGGKAVVRFFKGKPLFPQFDEDKKAEAMLNRGIDNINEEEKAVPAAPQGGTTNVYVQQNIYQGNPPPANQENPLPKIPTARIPDLPGIDPAAIEAANTQIEANPIPQAIEESQAIPEERQIAPVETEAIDIDD